MSIILNERNPGATQLIVPTITLIYLLDKIKGKIDLHLEDEPNSEPFNNHR